VYELTLIVLLRAKKHNQHDDENEVYNQYVHPDPSYNQFAV
jgi:hypothetical protein